MASAKKSICIISYTPILSEPRVLRQAIYFFEKGYEIVLVGLRDKHINYLPYRVVGINFLKKQYSESVFAKLFRFIGRVLIYILNAIGLGLEQRYDLHYGNIHLENDITKDSFDIIICHDYITAPLGIQLKNFTQNALLVIDCHEHFLSQNLSRSLIRNFFWYIKNGFFIKNFEKKMLKKADFITTVSEGISQALYRQYRLNSLPITVRSIVSYQQSAYHVVDKNKIRILYHGIIKPGRFLENLIIAAAYLKNCYEIDIRGPGSAEYIKTLKDVASKIGVLHRINFLEPVSTEDLVKEASSFDIGYFVWDGIGIQQQYVLPNKFFEYIMAGLALCVSDLPEMSKIVKHYGLGLLIPNSSPEAIAKMLNSLSTEQIESFKKNSLKAAKELNWELEAKKLDFLDNYLNRKSHVSRY